MRRFVAASAIAASLVVTGGTAVAISRVSPQSSVHTAAPVPTTTTVGGGHRSSKHADPLAAALAKLVANGTLTQKQADAVTAEVAAQRKARLKGRGRANGNRFGTGGRGLLNDASASVAKAIGITPDQLRTELASGKTIAEVATAHGVDPATVVASLEADVDSKLDGLVKKGEVTSAQKASFETMIHQAIEALVNGKGLGMFGLGGHLPQGFEGRPGRRTPPALPSGPPTSAAPATTPTNPSGTTAPPAPTTAVPTTSAASTSTTES